MNIKVLYFARLREELGCGEESLELEQPITMAALKSRLQQRGPQWQQALTMDNLLMSVNQVMVQGDAMVAGGDEVGFFPPVTGG